MNFHQRILRLSVLRCAQRHRWRNWTWVTTSLEMQQCDTYARAYSVSTVSCRHYSKFADCLYFWNTLHCQGLHRRNMHCWWSKSWYNLVQWFTNLGWRLMTGGLCEWVWDRDIIEPLPFSSCSDLGTSCCFLSILRGSALRQVKLPTLYSLYSL